ncbi:MAG TPA: polyprenyl synthetase family protein [Nitrososphaerales archaeon]|nr:polyprenyl synthetase family protein [Nitrososphaerales archaeon]
MAESSFDLDFEGKSESALEHTIHDYKKIIDNALRVQFNGDSYLSRAACKAILAGGKRTRAVLSLLSCEATCGDYAKAMPVALSFELAHSASLIQDDILDNSSTRHNEPAIHSMYGSVRAILVSDYLLFSIFYELSRLQDSGVSTVKLARILRYVAESAKLAAKGEFSDMLARTKGSITEEEYIETAGMKTGAIFAGAAAAGAVAGGANSQVVKAMYQYGHSYGVAFQILDDVLDFVGDPSKTGKPILKDYENHASNIVLVHALSKSSSSSIQELESSEIIPMIERNGSLEKAALLAQRFARLARSQLKILPDSRPKRTLDYLTHSLFASFRIQRMEEPR